MACYSTKCSSPHLPSAATTKTKSLTQSSLTNPSTQSTCPVNPSQSCKRSPPPKVWVLIRQLLTREPERRLGSGERDALEVMEHPYFKSVNFDDIYHKRVPPPFIPQLSSATDTSNFDQEFTREVPVLTPVHSGTHPRGKE